MLLYKQYTTVEATATVTGPQHQQQTTNNKQSFPLLPHLLDEQQDHNKHNFYFLKLFSNKQQLNSISNYRRGWRGMLLEARICKEPPSLSFLGATAARTSPNKFFSTKKRPQIFPTKKSLFQSQFLFFLTKKAYFLA